ncbi:hypothetical protein [Segetibacter sp. 3557_3]|uniref:hypothetical protein n=1 Tax=Segetibacter sp. 3557_3 TaxID=2547429 RepID=UPI00140455B0|nr:hypothetical protein [Segetibacter sp. 3557_3]
MPGTRIEGQEITGARLAAFGCALLVNHNGLIKADGLILHYFGRPQSRVKIGTTFLKNM